MAAQLKRALLESSRWLEPDDPLDLDLLLIADVPGLLLRASILELRRQLPDGVATVLVSDGEGTAPPADWLVELDRLGSVRRSIMQPGSRMSIDEIVKGARELTSQVAKAEVPEFADPIVRLVEVPGKSDLASEDLVMALGPLHPALPTPIRLVLALDGEQIRGVVGEPGYARSEASGSGIQQQLRRVLPPDHPQLAEFLFEAVEGERIANPGAWIVRLESERAQNLLLATARHLRLLGMVPHARNLVDLATRVGEAAPGPLASEVERLSAGLDRLTWFGLRTRSVGALSRIFVEEQGLTGPAARASGQLEDARLDGMLTPAYASLGFVPQTRAPGDDHARFHQRLAEAAQSLRLVDAASSLRPAPLEMNRSRPLAIETSRGRFELRVERTTSRKQGHQWQVSHVAGPSKSLLRVLPELLIGAPYADALVIIDGLDPCAEEVENTP